MSYVICEKCGGYYELQEGESPDDFDRCQCGGNLKYSENMEDYVQNEKRNYKTEKSRQYGDTGVYDDIKRDETYSYLEKRDKKMDLSKSQNLVVNAAFIILTFTIFPLKLGIGYNYFPFTVMAAFALILAVTLFYLQNAKKINTFGEIKKIYGICGLYFILFFLTLIVWVLISLVEFVFAIALSISNIFFFGFIFAYTFIFSQKFMESYVSKKISDPLASLGEIKKFIYYLGVFINIVWFLFVMVMVFYYSV